jgi:ribosomal protein S18 acetylase RimI-like enzyme
MHTESVVGRSEQELRFEPIDLDTAAETAIAFRADSFACSFGSTEYFFEANGKGHERYLAWLRQRMRSIPGSCVHVWIAATLVGQIETDQFKDDQETGYVNLYYLAPDYRNRGLGHRLDEYATAFLRGLGFRRARLNVSPTNRQAVAFYVKNGWRDLGPAPTHPEVHAMEKDLVPSD